MNLNKKVYLFGEGNKDLKGLLGGKGANLSEMTNMGLPVPPGFTITTEVCIDYSKRGAIVYNEIESLVWEYIKELEKKTGKIFGDPQADAPLLVSVRSGAKFSMPGMMDTILNLGLNDQIIKNFARYMGDSRVAYDCYRRFIQMFSNVVLGIKGEKFEEILSEFKNAKKVKLDIQLDTEDLEELVKKYKSIVLNSTGKEFPDDPKTQLKMAIIAVFESWNNPRAQTYRKLNNIPDDLGTAVNVQVMVYGNAGNDSATGVGFTRNPSTGQRILYGEFLQNAQGEDVVAGIRTPRDVHELKAIFPEIFVQILNISNRLEAHYKDVQDFEFSIEKGILYMLQTRDAKRTAQSAVKTAVEMMKEGFISKQEAILRVKSDQIEQLLHYQIDPNEKNLHILTKGLNASPGAAKGNVVFSADDAVKWAQEGRNVVLVSPETTPDDIHGMAVAQGILTQHGGMTSHAAVVARAMGKPCVAGAEEISINIEEKFFTINDHLIKEGTTITINGTTGDVILGGAPLIEPEYSGEFKELLSYADEYRDLKIRTNADTPKFAQNALKFGAEGIGLCRTERMFNDPDRLPVVQQMILAKTKEQRLEYLKKLEVMQRKDFLEIFKIMNGLPVTIRLLDLPLHEFLPLYEDLLTEVTIDNCNKRQDEEFNKKKEKLERIKSLREHNPMIGHRGVRIGITYPEIYEMQVKVIIQAAIDLTKEGIKVIPEIMLPLVSDVNELIVLKNRLVKVINNLIQESGIKLEYFFGTMIEVARACLTADDIAKDADFFSFGTNDLTQTTYGYSRDDAEGKFLQFYLENNILKKNPFEILDTRGVGKLIEMAVKLGRGVKPSLKIGCCGEIAGEPSSIEFLQKVGLDYVSCSPYRVPIARLAAAHAYLKNKSKKSGP